MRLADATSGNERRGDTSAMIPNGSAASFETVGGNGVRYLAAGSSVHDPLVIFNA
jgi:hypothetical protein